MGSSLSLIHLPAQSGKTRKMTDLINRWKHLIDYTGNSTDSINVIFTSNTKLLTKQTAGRIKKEVDDASQVSDLSDDEDDFSIDMDVKEKEIKTIAWISTTDKKNKKTMEKVFLDVVTSVCNNIICCTNKTRMKNVWELLTALNTMFLNRSFNKRVNIWIDEADACIKIWDVYMGSCEEFIDSKLIQNIVLVTATMVPVYKHLHRAGIEPNLRTYENTHAPVYHKYSESELCHAYSENAKYATVQLKAVLEHNPEMVSAGTRLFCPGNKAKKSHEEICDELLANRFNVLLLNGAYKEIRFFDGRPPIEIAELLETDLEVSITLNRLYYEHELFNSPFAVTGNLCIGRGITFASQIDGREFLFTHGIIPEVANGDEGYQMVARCCGNIKGHATYQVPKIFVSERTDALIRVQENLAVEFASKFFQQGVDSMVKVTRGMLNDAIGPDEKEERRRAREESPDNKKNIPIVVLMDNSEIIRIHELKTSQKRGALLAVLKENLVANGKESLATRLDSFEIQQITRPVTEKSRKKSIYDPVNAATNLKPYAVNVTDKSKNTWQATLDDKENRVVFIIYCEP